MVRTDKTSEDKESFEVADEPTIDETLSEKLTKYLVGWERIRKRVAGLILGMDLAWANIFEMARAVYENTWGQGAFMDFQFKVRNEIYTAILKENISKLENIDDKLFWTTYNLTKVFEDVVIEGGIAHTDFIDIVERLRWPEIAAKLNQLYIENMAVNSFNIPLLALHNPVFYDFLSDNLIIANDKITPWYIKRFIKELKKKLKEPEVPKDKISSMVDDLLAPYRGQVLVSAFGDTLKRKLVLEYTKSKQKDLFDEESKQEKDKKHEETRARDKAKKEALRKEVKETPNYKNNFSPAELRVSYWAYYYSYDWEAVKIPEKIAEKMSTKEVMDYFVFIKALKKAKIYDFYDFYRDELEVVAKNRWLNLDLKPWSRISEDDVYKFFCFILEIAKVSWKFTDSDWKPQEKTPPKNLDEAINKIKDFEESEDIWGYKMSPSSQYCRFEQYCRKIWYIKHEIPTINIMLMSEKSL